MTLQDLQKQLRAHIRARIRRGEMTGSELAREAEFPQGHLSNFLNARRGLSLESMDRLLDTLDIGVLDLVDAKDIQKRAALPEAAEGVERIALVSAENAVLARFAPSQILETRSFNKSFLRKLKPRLAEDRRDWLRFVMIKLDVKGARPFAFRTPAATLLIDRHYSSLQPYRRLQPNVYAVSFGGRCVMGYVSVFEDYLVLRPRDPQQEVEMIRIERGRSYSEHIVGRVCHVGLEL
ncbi:MAG: helix-turn-helix domain-containing protein [Candidatus Korobacteraceae bacterium]|jgi:transcriptional regulator with XRE-family HTH domain